MQVEALVKFLISQASSSFYFLPFLCPRKPAMLEMHLFPQKLPTLINPLSYFSLFLKRSLGYKIKLHARLQKKSDLHSRRFGLNCLNYSICFHHIKKTIIGSLQLHNPSNYALSGICLVFRFFFYNIFLTCKKCHWLWSWDQEEKLHKQGFEWV